MAYHSPVPLTNKMHIRSPGMKGGCANKSVAYAIKVIGKPCPDGKFNALYKVEHARHVPKLEKAEFEAVSNRGGRARESTLMFEEES